MKKITFFITLFCACFILDAYSQDNSVIKNAVAGLKTLSGDHMIERAYLHFDKPYYAAGDTIYFKAYVVLGEHFDLSKGSVVLHVDLINPNNTIINSIKLQLGNGVGWGDFALPLVLPRGNYRVRAYTQYMQNAPEYFFDRTIPVGSAISNSFPADNKALPSSAKADLQFFPEGGELISAMVSKVAFKAIGINGLGVNLKGVVVDNNNNQVTTLASSHLGMGTFYIAPEEGKTYKAKVTFEDGSQSIFDLPATASKGITLAARDTLDKMTIEIHSNKAYFQENLNKNISLVIYGSGFVNTVNTKLDNRRLSMDIPNSQFPSGIVQVTLFSQTGEPLSERLVFVQNPDLVNLTVSSDKTTYTQRERVSVKLKAKDKGADVEGHFSASVTDESKVPLDENNETTILSYLLLTSGLRGYVEQPNYYFVHNSNQTYADLDALMLTQGYRRFTWKQLLSNDEQKFTFAAEKSLTISGVAKNATGSPINDMDVMLLTSKTGNMLGDRSNKEGKFKFDGLIFADTSLLTLQATGSTRTRNTAVFTVDPDSPGPPVAVKPLPGMQDDVNQSMITYLSASQALHNNSYENITVHSTGDHHADEAVSGDEIRSSTSLVKALNEHLHAVNFVQGIPYLKGGSTKDPMLVVVNGKIVGSYVNLDNISPGDLEKVEVLKGNNADSFGVYGNSGVLSITYRAGAAKNIAQDASYKYSSKSVVKLKSVSPAESKDSYLSSNLGGAGHADQVVKGEQINNATSLTNALTGILRGVNIINGIPYLNTSLIIQGGSEGTEPMYVVLDGSQLSGSIDEINPREVETVELLKGPNASIYGMNGGAGVLVITLRNKAADVVEVKSTLGSLVFRANGFHKAREFYSPKYEATTNNGRRDLRSTIFWDPELQTNKDGEASFEFYNADGRGTYRVVIEGIDNAGNIGRQVYRYKVE